MKNYGNLKNKTKAWRSKPYASTNPQPSGKAILTSENHPHALFQSYKIYELKKIADSGNSQRQFKLWWISHRAIAITFPLVGSVMIVYVCVCV